MCARYRTTELDRCCEKPTNLQGSSSRAAADWIDFGDFLQATSWTTAQAQSLPPRFDPPHRFRPARLRAWLAVAVWRSQSESQRGLVSRVDLSTLDLGTVRCLRSVDIRSAATERICPIVGFEAGDRSVGGWNPPNWTSRGRDPGRATAIQHASRTGPSDVDACS